MKKLELFYPVEPHHINLAWGVRDEKKYKQFGFLAHNGVDLRLARGQAIYAPIDCDVVNVGSVPNGSGIFVSVISKEAYIFENGVVSYILLDFMHCQKINVVNSASVKTGQILAYGDNTGFSDGDHTHMQARRISLQQVSNTSNINSYRIRENNFVINDVDSNDANNSFDPKPFWNGKYANHYNPELIGELQKRIIELTQQLKNIKKV